MSHTTIKGVPKEYTVLVGRLRIPDVPFSKDGPPFLTIDVWCPECRGLHHHGIAGAHLPGFRLHFASHRGAHCWNNRSAYRSGNGYYIAADPAWRDEHRALVRELRGHVEKWRAWKERRAARASAPEPAP
jgi:hypothetical protein